MCSCRRSRPTKQTDAEEVIALTQAAGQQAVAVPGDLKDEAYCEQLVTRAVTELGASRNAVAPDRDQRLLRSDGPGRKGRCPPCQPQRDGAATATPVPVGSRHNARSAATRWSARKRRAGRYR